MDSVVSVQNLAARLTQGLHMGISHYDRGRVHSQASERAASKFTMPVTHRSKNTGRSHNRSASTHSTSRRQTEECKYFIASYLVAVAITLSEFTRWIVN
jgi:hypothetical protein